jgi:hypothetical protein
MERRNAQRGPGRPARGRFVTDDHGDDNCPLCVAARAGRPFEIMDYFPTADGGPPPMITEDFLIDEALKALGREPVRPQHPVEFMQFGQPRPDGTVAHSAFTVDGDGEIYWTSPTQHRRVAGVDIGGRSPAPVQVRPS